MYQISAKISQRRDSSALSLLYSKYNIIQYGLAQTCSVWYVPMYLLAKDSLQARHNCTLPEFVPSMKAGEGVGWLFRTTGNLKKCKQIYLINNLSNY